MQTKPAAVLATIAALLALTACATNPPPRPMPRPSPNPSRHASPSPLSSQDAARHDQRQAEARRVDEGGQPAHAPKTAQAAGPTTPPAGSSPGVHERETSQPAWYRVGVQILDGREHRAFVVSAADVRDARNRAMQLAYEAYPQGDVAAHEAVRLGDGTWRFYVLIAANG